MYIQNKLWSVAATIIIVLTLASCTNTTQNIGLKKTIDPNSLAIKRIFADVYAYNKKITRHEANRQSPYKLGKTTNTRFGNYVYSIASQFNLPSYSPSFGTYSQSTENGADTDDKVLTIPEKETVTEVHLYIPFFSDFDRDSNNNIQKDSDDNNLYVLDSIYGNRANDFQVKIHRLSYFFSDADPNNFSEASKYYSDLDLSSFKSDLIADTPIKISSKEIVIYKEDDPDTTTDESKTVDKRIKPRLDITLDKDFFQKNIIDKEGSTELSNGNEFKNYLRGMLIEIPNLTNDLLILLDFNTATIDIKYDYQAVDQKGTTDDTSDDVIETKNKTLTINLGATRGHVVNTYQSTDGSIKIDNDNAKEIYLKGGSYFTELRIFDPENSTTKLEQFRARDILINEANLTFYIDETVSKGGFSVSPNRIYLYNMNDGKAIVDYTIDPTTGATAAYKSKLVYGGKKDDNGQYYKIRLTEHINRIITKDSTNVNLGLVVTSNISNVNTVDAFDANNKKYEIPVASIGHPGEITFYGPHPAVAEDKRLRLELYYTDEQ